MRGAVYRLTVEGELGDQVLAAVGGVTAERRAGLTIMRGAVRDQTDLRRLLGRVSDLGLTLLSLSCEPASPADP